MATRQPFIDSNDISYSFFINLFNLISADLKPTPMAQEIKFWVTLPLKLNVMPLVFATL